MNNNMAREELYKIASIERYKLGVINNEVQLLQNQLNNKLFDMNHQTFRVEALEHAIGELMSE